MFAGVVVDRSGFESEVEPATEVEFVLVEAAVDRSRFESEADGPVDRELLRLGRGVVAVTIGIVVGKPSAGLAVDSPVYMSRDTKQQPPRSPVLLPKPVQCSKCIHSSAISYNFVAVWTKIYSILAIRYNFMAVHKDIRVLME